jgi:hypothetical protein
MKTAQLFHVIDEAASSATEAGAWSPESGARRKATADADRFPAAA